MHKNRRKLRRHLGEIYVDCQIWAYPNNEMTILNHAWYIEGEYRIVELIYCEIISPNKYIEQSNRQRKMTP